MANILVVYYSQGGSVAQLAQHVARGVNQVPNMTASLRVIPSVTATIQASDKPIPDQGAPYVEIADIDQCAGLIIGTPTRFGNMAAATKYFLDGLSKQWMNGSLAGKPAAVFTSSASIHGGQEATLLSMHVPLLHQGCLIVGIPYTEPALTKTRTGGTPYGASHVAGAHDDPHLSDDETVLACCLGNRVARVAACLDNRPF